MDTVFGFTGKGFSLVAADASAARSILVFKQDADKITKLDSHKLCASSGVPADSSNFLEFISKNMKLYELDNGLKLDTPEAAGFIRSELATALRRGPYQCNLVLAGYDGDADSGRPSVYFIDYMASCVKLNFACHGHAANFLLSVMDREWKENMTEAEALDLVRNCIKALHTRFLISQPNFKVKIVDHNGVRDVVV